MNSGVTSQLTHGRVFSSRGTHQKFDRTAYQLIADKINVKKFPTRAQVLHFEGYDGPDGLNMKSRRYSADHLWDPINEIGSLPMFIQSHFDRMTEALKKNDHIEASFHAAWLGHYLTDSLTPAHHMSHKLIAQEYKSRSKVARSWLYWGRKGLKSSHVAFEVGVSSSVFFTPLKVKFDHELYSRVRTEGLVAAVKQESRLVANQHIYRDFLEKGWTRSIAKRTRKHVINRIPQLIAAAWLAAYEEAGGKVKI